MSLLSNYCRVLEKEIQSSGSSPMKVRGQKHLLNNIHRQKPVHSHSLLAQRSASLLLSEAERYDGK